MDKQGVVHPHNRVISAQKGKEVRTRTPMGTHLGALGEGGQTEATGRSLHSANPGAGSGLGLLRAGGGERAAKA